MSLIATIWLTLPLLTHCVIEVHCRLPHSYKLGPMEAMGAEQEGPPSP